MELDIVSQTVQQRFFVEQVAICPPDPARAVELLSALGLTEWVSDIVVARGSVFADANQENRARLAFNYEATRMDGDRPARPLELEVLHYEAGNNWMAYNSPRVSHLGMHCTDDELEAWRERFASLGIGVAQEVFTQSHSNPAIAGKRWYQYVIFNTRGVLGVDLKFIVRRSSPGA